MNRDNFDDLRPYHDDEINPAMQRIAANPLISKVADFLYPDVQIADLKNMLRNITTIREFQKQVMHHAINEIIKKSITNFSFNGFENLEKDKAYIFISNHRDILLDSALLQIALDENGFNTSEITFGSNLMVSDFVVDIGKSNKMFKVIRGGTPRDFYKNSLRLSQYIRHAITEKNESIWIAQRNGRTKDGNDKTDQGIIKMFAMSSDKVLNENILELNIAPMVISYEWETCDAAKLKELYVSRTQKYVKAPGEDLNSILNGITQFKGNVHIEITQPLKDEELVGLKNMDKHEMYNYITNLINTRIHTNYKFWKTNYIAFDIENNSTEYLNKKYTKSDLESFVDRMENTINKIEGNKSDLKSIYLGIYSNPIKNIKRNNYIK
ncbi:MAG TPA: acyltransferase [Bacteroidales bacterium]|nr:acyltransferase [Bacteroidales bacterium]